MGKLLSGYRILVVEDEMMNLAMLEDVLAEAGCEDVTGAATIDQAMALIDGWVFDAAMLDVRLRSGDSYAVADALAARKVPFVFATGNNVRDIRDGYRNVPIIRKPFKDEQLVEALRAILPRRENGD
jgi:CheY-like chemotaxis protein